jgi:hypothetical protein
MYLQNNDRSTYTTSRTHLSIDCGSDPVACGLMEYVRGIYGWTEDKFMDSVVCMFAYIYSIFSGGL